MKSNLSNEERDMDMDCKCLQGWSFNCQRDGASHFRVKNSGSLLSAHHFSDVFVVLELPTRPQLVALNWRILMRMGMATSISRQDATLLRVVKLLVKCWSSDKRRCRSFAPTSGAPTQLIPARWRKPTTARSWTEEAWKCQWSSTCGLLVATAEVSWA